MQQWRKIQRIAMFRTKIGARNFSFTMGNATKDMVLTDLVPQEMKSFMEDVERAYSAEHAGDEDDEEVCGNSCI